MKNRKAKVAMLIGFTAVYLRPDTGSAAMNLLCSVTIAFMLASMYVMLNYPRWP